MGLLDRIRGLLGGGEEDDEARYRCIRCGEGYERDRRTCEVCGSEFLAATEGDDTARPDELL